MVDASGPKGRCLDAEVTGRQAWAASSPPVSADREL
jgi:hypothetical protein